MKREIGIVQPEYLIEDWPGKDDHSSKSDQLTRTPLNSRGVMPFRY